MSMMQLARVHAAGDVRLDEVPVPSVGLNDVLVKVKACGICGSDLSYIAMGGLGGAMPMPIGHEFSGIVHAVGANITQFAVGDRVAGNPDDRSFGSGGPEGAMGDYILIPESTASTTLHPIPDHMPYETAALAEPLSVALHGIDLVKVQPEDKVTVLGAGPIGLCAVKMLRHRGVTNIVVVDRVASRLERAKKLGAHIVINTAEQDLAEAISAAQGEGMRYGKRTWGTDVFIDAAGAPPVLQQVVAHAKFGARISIIALYKGPTEIDLFQVMANEIHISGSIADKRSAEFQEALDVMAADPADCDVMISHRSKLQSLISALSTAADPVESAKVMLMM